jgi:tetratricopeptide (TPR) repeat protein
MYRIHRTLFAIAVIGLILTGCNTYIQKGDEALNRGSWAEAVSHYQKALAEKPADAELLDKYNRAKAEAHKQAMSEARQYLARGDYEKAAARCEDGNRYADPGADEKALGREIETQWKKSLLQKGKETLLERKFYEVSRIAAEALTRWPDDEDFTAIKNSTLAPIALSSELSDEGKQFVREKAYGKALSAYGRSLEVCRDNPAAVAGMREMRQAIDATLAYFRSFAYEKENLFEKAKTLAASDAFTGVADPARRKVLEALAESGDMRLLVARVTAKFDGYKNKHEKLNTRLELEVTANGQAYSDTADADGIVLIKIPQGAKIKYKGVYLGDKRLSAAFPGQEYETSQSPIPFGGYNIEVYIPASGKILTRSFFSNSTLEVYEDGSKLKVRKLKPAEGIVFPKEFLAKRGTPRAAALLCRYGIDRKETLKKWKAQSKDLWAQHREMAGVDQVGAILKGYESVCLNPGAYHNEDRIATLITMLLANDFKKSARALAEMPAAIFPETATAQRWTGAFLEQMNDAEQSLAFYRKAVDLALSGNKPAEVKKSLAALSSLNRRLGRYDAAIKDARQLLDNMTEDRGRAVRAVVTTLVDARATREAVELLVSESEKDLSVFYASLDNFWLLYDNGKKTEALRLSKKLRDRKDLMKLVLPEKNRSNSTILEVAAIGEMVQGHTKNVIRLYAPWIAASGDPKTTFDRQKKLARFLERNGSVKAAENILRERVGVAERHFRKNKSEQSFLMVIDAMNDTGDYQHSWKVLSKYSGQFKNAKGLEWRKRALLSKKDVQKYLGRKAAASLDDTFIAEYVESCWARVDYEGLESFLKGVLKTHKNRPDLTAELIECLRKSGKTEEAMQLAETSIRKHPNDAGLLKAYGYLLADAKEYAKAKQALSKSLTLVDSAAAEDWVKLGKTEAIIGNYTNAYADFEKARSLKRNIRIPEFENIKSLSRAEKATSSGASEDLMLEYALLLETVGNTAKAEKVYQSILGKDPATVEGVIKYADFLYRQNRTDESMAMLEKALRRDLPVAGKERIRQAIGHVRILPKVEKYVFEGRRAVWQGDHDAGIALLESAHQLDPGNIEVLYELGQAYESAGPRYSAKAMKSYNYILAIQPGYAPAVAAKQSLDKISSSLQRLAAFPNDSEEAIKVSKEYRKRRWLPEAEKIIKRVLAKDPDNVEALHEQYEMYQEWTFIGRNRGVEALAVAKKVAALKPREKRAKKECAWACSRAGRYTEGYRIIDALIADDPDNLSYLNTKASLLSGSGKPREAIAIYKKMLEIQPKGAYIWRNMGLSYGTLDRLGEAESAYRKAFSLRDEDDVYARSLASSLFAQRRFDESKQLYLEALALNPRSISARSGLATICIYQNRLDEALNYAKEMAGIPDGLIGSLNIRYYVAEKRNDDAEMDRIAGEMLDEIEREVARYPEDPRYRIKMANALIRFEKDPQRALALIEKAIEMGSESYLNDLKRVRAKIACGVATSKDIEYLKGFTKKMDWVYAAHEALAAYDIKHGNKKAAIARINKLLKIRPSLYYESMVRKMAAG